MKALLLKRFLSSFILLTSLLLSTITFGQAALMSDLSDYDPGSTCTLTGTGFLPGETVHIRVLHSIDHPEDYTGVEHEPWPVTADSTGNFVTTWQVSDSHCIGKLLKATAIGQSSGENVWTEFTDPTKTSTSSGGNWNVGSTWVGGSVPLSTDDVVIAVGATVTVTDNRTAKSITIAGGSSDTELRINSGITLAVSGDVTINSPGSNNRDSEITVGSGILNIGGNLTVNGTTSGNSRRGRLTVSTGSVDVNGNITTNAAGSNALISFSNNGTLNVGGNWTHDGAFTKSTSTVTFDGTTQSISGGVALDFNVFTIASSSTTTANTAPLASTFNINGNGKYIQKTGSIVPGTTRNFAPTSTYEWQSGGGVNFPSTSGIAFGNLTINSTSGNNSAGGNLTTVNGDLYIQNTTGGSYRIASSTSPTLTIGGDLQIDGGTLNFSTGSGSPTVNVTGNVLISGGTLRPMTSSGVPVFNVTGNWTNNATYTAGSETVIFNGGSQIIGGSNPTIFGGLTIAGSADKTLGKDITVSNTLSLSDKKINTGTNVLTANSITRTTGFIVGNLRKSFTSSILSHTFDVGQTLYAPVSVAFSSVTTSGFLTARTDDGEHGDIGTSTLDPFNSINRNWTVTKDALLGHGNYNLTLTYDSPADHDGGTTPSSFKIGKFNSGDPTPWTYPTISGTPTATSITATGLTGFSSFAVASSCANPVVTDNPDDATKCVGESVSFSVVATFPGIATYTWRKGGVVIVGAPNSSTYTISSVAIGDAGSYDVVITRPCGGTATSSIASLTVNIPTTITTQPTNQTVTYGNNAGFSTVGSGSGTLGYQWQLSTDNGSNFSDIPSAINPTLDVNLPTVLMNGYKYRVMVSGICGNVISDEVTLTVNKADATIIVNGYTGVYDGNAHGASGSATGVLGEDLSASLSLGSTFTDVPGGTVNWTFSGGTNYNDDSGSVAINISKADATIIVNGYTGVYDGNAHGASGSATGVLGEDLSASLSLGSTFTDVPGGTVNWTFSGGTNYNDDSGSVAINISKADATIIVNGYTGTYDGNAHGASGSATGVLGEDLSANLSLGSTFTDVPGGTANWTFSGGTNYNDDGGSVAINITKADADINVIGYTGIYDGNAHGASGTATGVASEDLSAGLYFGSSFTDVPGGTASWTFTGGTNYNNDSGSVVINITKADADINVIGYTGTYDGNAHGASGTAIGVASEDLSAGLNFGSSFTDVPGGTANWTFSGGTNYNDDSGSVAINITKADADINVMGYTGIYDGNAHGASGTAIGVASEDLSAGLNFGLSFTDVPGGTASWMFTGGTNYNNASGTVGIVINKKTVTVSADAKSKIFGDADPSFTYQLNEVLLPGNAISGLLSRTSGESAGLYPINTGTLLVSNNYLISFVGENLSIIMPPPMTATVAKTNITCYGANDGTIAITNSTGGLGIYEYRLNTGTWQTSGSFVNLTPGTYNVQMRDPVRTIFSADLGNQVIDEPSVLNAQTSKTNISCNGIANGSITILNPTGGSGSYEFSLNSGAWQSSPSFGGLTANTYAISMRDTVHQSCVKNLGSQTVSEPEALSALCTNSNNILYFGYAGDQTSTINVKPSGGVGPYKVSITMNRPLKCNVVNNTGDEVWAPGLSTVSNVNTGCPTSGTPSLLPISASAFTINATVGYSLNVTLMADATFTATITDSNGCITTCTTTILAEDVRCFSGNSTRPKVNICHKTGSTKNPCVSICVDDNAVAEHIAHGDFLGKCTSNCLDPNGTRSLEEETFNVKTYPNPSDSVFNLEIENGSEEEVAIEVFDISGRKIKQLSAIDVHIITFGEVLPRGVYLVYVQQGSNSKTIRVVKK